MTTHTVSVKEKIGYGLGDTASNIVFQVVINFLMLFYTDVFGISAAAVGTLMLVVRVFDGITDPLMGSIADRTRSRWGRYRPWLIIAALPYGLLAVLAFTTPDLSDNGKLVYAYVTYSLLMTAYTVINIPYSALGGVITSDPAERGSVQAWRFAMAMVGGAIVTSLMMPLVDFFGMGDQARGFQLAMAAFSSLAVICFVICFFTTRERVLPDTDQKSEPILKSALSLLRNDQWLVVAAITFFLLVLVAMRGAVTAYYVKYFLLREDLISQYITTGMVAAIFGALATNLALKHVNKIRLFYLGTAGVMVFHLALYALPSGWLTASFMLFAAANFSQMIVVPLMFSMVADTADYGEQQTGTNNMAMCFSGHLLVIKLALALGGALVGWMLEAFGYVANEAQTDKALNGILIIFSVVPALCCVGIFAALHRYKLAGPENRWPTQQVVE